MKQFAFILVAGLLACGENPVAQSQPSGKASYWITGTHSFDYTLKAIGPQMEGYAYTKIKYRYVSAPVKPFLIVIGKDATASAEVSYKAICQNADGHYLDNCQYTEWQLIERSTQGRYTTFKIRVTIPRYEEVRLDWAISFFEHDNEEAILTEVTE